MLLFLVHGGKFLPVSNFTWLHALTQVVCSYAELWTHNIANTHLVVHSCRSFDKLLCRDHGKSWSHSQGCVPAHGLGAGASALLPQDHADGQANKSNEEDFYTNIQSQFSLIPRSSTSSGNLGWVTSVIASYPGRFLIPSLMCSLGTWSKTEVNQF